MSPTDTNLRQLMRSIVLLLVVGAVVVALLAAFPSLAAVTRQLGHAQAGWVVLALVAELASCFAFVFFFQGIFWRGPRRLAARLAWAEMAAGALLPAGGADGLGLGAFALRKLGMSGCSGADRSHDLPVGTDARRHRRVRPPSGDLHRPISPRVGSWPPRDHALTPGRSAHPAPAETAPTRSDSHAGPDFHSDLLKPFKLATGPLPATKERLP